MKLDSWGWGDGDGAERSRAGMGIGLGQHKIHPRPITHGGYDFHPHPRQTRIPTHTSLLIFYKH